MRTLETDLEGLLQREIVTLSDDSRVDALGSVSLRLLQELSNEEDDRGGSVSGLLVLGDSCAGDHGGGGVLERGKKAVSEVREPPEREARRGLTWICISERSTFPS